MDGGRGGVPEEEVAEDHGVRGAAVLAFTEISYLAEISHWDSMIASRQESVFPATSVTEMNIDIIDIDKPGTVNPSIP